MWEGLLWLGLLWCLTSLTYYLLKPHERDRLLEKFGIRRRRATGSLTPPRDLSPEKPGFIRDQAEPTANADLFPPSRTGHTPNYNLLLPSDQTPTLKQHAQHVTATGYTLSEIKDLGDFPDYASLSGVPLPSAWNEFDITTAQPRPYRPLRWAYHQTMSLNKLEPDWWLELESAYTERIRQRVQLFEQHGSAVLDVQPGSEIAAKELMEMCIQFLTSRYPHYFHLDRPTRTFHNKILNTTTDLAAVPPMHVLLHNIPEDFAIMLRNPATGLYHFRGGMICSSLGWTLGTKMGLPLHEIHSPVPDYKDKMQFSMDRFFAKFPTDKPIQRGSWGLEVDAPLYMPPGDPHEALRDAQNPAHTLAQCNLRVDWQTLRRLPLSGAIVFNFKALFTPVTEFRDEPRIPSLMAKILREGKQSIMQYKNTWHTEHLVLPALDLWAQEQVAAGQVDADWQPQTLDQAPFFEGWTQKWRRQQGF